MAVPDNSSSLRPDAMAPAASELSGASTRPIEELLRERIKLDEVLQQAYRRDVTLLCTAMQNVPGYFEQHGDLSGRQMVQRHHDLLSPILTSHQGTILRSVKDTMMVSFADPAAAVQSAIAMQRALREHNSGRGVAEQMHIRVGINSGQALVETQDVFGNVVHVATRLEDCALPDQILVSSATYERLPPSIPCRLLGATDVRGQSTPIELYEVHWDERRTFQETVLLRGPGIIARPTKIFVLEVSRDHERLKLSAHERWPGEERAVRHYAYREVSFEAIQQEVDTMVGLLNRITDRRGSLAPAVWQDIKARGAALYSQLLTPAVQEQLRSSTATDLVLAIDDTLVQIPWELLFDGQTFLCRRLSMGRLVSTRQDLVEPQERQPAATLKMLIVADPQGDLAAAAREGQTIQEELNGAGQRLQVEAPRRRLGTAYVKTALAQYDVLHYAGHADYDLQDPAQSGWRLADGKWTARDVLELGQEAPLPALVFCNACQSGQTQEWSSSQDAEQGIYGLANAFLLAGAQHYIGSFWEIPDQPGAAFAIAFYRALAQGLGVGEALRRARANLAERYGEESVVWASYVLYGDPTCRYLEAAQEDCVLEEEPLLASPAVRGESRRTWRQHSSLLLTASVLLLCLGLATAWLTTRHWPGGTEPLSPLGTAYQLLEQGDRAQATALFERLAASTEPHTRGQAYAGLAAVAFAAGDSQRALELATQAEKVEPQVVYSHVIRGHILAQQGKTTEAMAAYRRATDNPPSTLPWQQAVAYDRLGRLYAAQGETGQALQHYDRAISQQRDLAVVHADKAYLLDKLGKHQEALEFYRQALQINPQDPLTLMLLREAERRQLLAQDRDEQQRLADMVDALVQAYRADRTPAVASDEWTSRPLSLAFLPVQDQGHPAARAGAAEFVVLSLMQALRSSGRVRVVEREVLDKVLAELKLSTSEIVNSAQALHKGNILVARLLASGSLARFGKAGLLSMRLIETETTMISAAVTQVVETPDDLLGVTERVAQNLLREIRQTFPLQARIARLAPQGGVVLDIGALHGVTNGVVFQVFTSAGADDAVPMPVGRLEVTQVLGQFSQARVLEELAPFAPGNKVREVLGE